MRIFFILLSFLFISHWATGQGTATIIGTVTDEDEEPMPFVTVYIEELKTSVQTQMDGQYKIIVPAQERLTLVYSVVGKIKLKYPIDPLPIDTAIRRNVQMESSDNTTIKGVVVRTFEEKEADGQIINPEDIEQIPTTTMNLESVLQFVAVGVAAGTGGELTSQYSVRGGNYDENLVYVNGFEIYRPLLIRAGQQEGLTFPNPDMLRNLSFSSGGFKAEYGDKMASVLDVRYRRPKKFEGSVGASMLGASAYVGGAVYFDETSRRKAKEKGSESAMDSVSPYRLTYTLGARYKTTRYLLGGLDLQGQYVPNFMDVQGNIIYDINPYWQWEIIGNYSNSIFKLIPKSGETVSGLFNQALRLTTIFDGQELSNFETFMTGTAITFKPQMNNTDKGFLRYRLLASHYQSYENERIDIQGFYRLDEIETGLGEDNFGEVVGTLAYGETHEYARNFLKSKVTQVQLRGDWIYEKNNVNQVNDSLTKISDHEIFLKWGLGYKNEIILDDLKEWTRYDSLGYSQPFDTSQIIIDEYIKTKVNLNTHRLTGFLQNTWDHKTNKNHWRITAGVRASYWNLNKELLISPRLQMYYTPRKFVNPLSDSTSKTKDLTFKLAVGAYYQPPFYRELRNLDGDLNTDVRAQKSIHALGGIVWDFVMFKRPFKFITEAYYKHQWDLIAYDVENVRIRYYGENNMKGYVAGLDLRLNGELVDGLESWVNLSFLRARESFDSVQHKVRKFVGSVIDTFDLADVPKPTDQLVIFSMYFQDYFPKAPWFKVNLAFTVGTGLPFGIPRNNVEYRNTYRFPHYHRIDLGFSLAIWDRKTRMKKQYDGSAKRYWNDEANKHAFKKIQSIWFSLEIFNLTNNKNVASNNWIKDFTNRSYAIPNNLTSIRFNGRLRINF